MATIADATALRAIYAQYIDTPISFEYELPSEAAFADRVGDILKIYPYLVCESEGRVVGYAYAHRQLEREAYGWNAELSIYIDRSALSQGIGRSLYGALIEILSAQGIRNVFGGVTLPNPKSEGLHQSMGFRRAGVYHRTGYKCGRWHDVVWFEKQIGNCDGEPAPLLPITEVLKQRLDAILERYCE